MSLQTTGIPHTSFQEPSPGSIFLFLNYFFNLFSAVRELGGEKGVEAGRVLVHPLLSNQGMKAILEKTGSLRESGGNDGLHVKPVAD
ncbi:MAG: hypothetical protein VXX42_04355, partial [SAR324 cluster bacterium]|nr:hypothetical protein [SAR324 cluster bacterium]